jgi:hypothetical protein
MELKRENVVASKKNGGRVVHDVNDFDALGQQVKCHGVANVL